jgi:hypothetical protein
MAKKILFPTFLDLQLFAEGGAGGASGTSGDGGTGTEGATGVTATAAVSQTKGVKSNHLADVKYGTQTEDTTPAAKVETAPAEDRVAKFEALIKGEYKDLYDARMQDTMQKRLKGVKESEKEAVDKYSAIVPILETLAKKHGVDATDIEALTKAIEEDDSYYEQEALEKGITVEQLKEFRKMEKEVAELRKIKDEQNRRENANKLYAQWTEQEQKAKAIYPNLNLMAEMQNPQFVNLLRSNIDVQTAFEVIHKDEIIPAAMQYTAKQVEEKISNKIIAGGARPTENGNSSQGASITKSDVSTLTKADLAEINRRVARGERISFG